MANKPVDGVKVSWDGSVLVFTDPGSGQVIATLDPASAPGAKLDHPPKWPAERAA